MKTCHFSYFDEAEGSRLEIRCYFFSFSFPFSLSLAVICTVNTSNTEGASDVDAV